MRYRHPFSLALLLTFSLVFFMIVLAFFLNDDPRYVWTPFVSGETEADDVHLNLDVNPIPVGYQNFQLTITNTSSYAIGVFRDGISIQKYENTSWHSIHDTLPQDSETTNALGEMILFPSESYSYDFLLPDIFPISVQNPGEYRIYCPFYYRLDKQDHSKTFASYTTIPITLING